MGFWTCMSTGQSFWASKRPCWINLLGFNKEPAPWAFVRSASVAIAKLTTYSNNLGSDRNVGVCPRPPIPFYKELLIWYCFSKKNPKWKPFMRVPQSCASEINAIGLLMSAAEWLLIKSKHQMCSYKQYNRIIVYVHTQPFLFSWEHAKNIFFWHYFVKNSFPKDVGLWFLDLTLKRGASLVQLEVCLLHVDLLCLLWAAWRDWELMNWWKNHAKTTKSAKTAQTILTLRKLAWTLGFSWEKPEHPFSLGLAWKRWRDCWRWRSSSKRFWSLSSKASEASGRVGKRKVG